MNRLLLWRPTPRALLFSIVAALLIGMFVEWTQTTYVATNAIRNVDEFFNIATLKSAKSQATLDAQRRSQQSDLDRDLAKGRIDQMIEPVFPVTRADMRSLGELKDAYVSRIMQVRIETKARDPNTAFQKGADLARSIVDLNFRSRLIYVLNVFLSDFENEEKDAAELLPLAIFHLGRLEAYDHALSLLLERDGAAPDASNLLMPNIGDEQAKFLPLSVQKNALAVSLALAVADKERLVFQSKARGAFRLSLREALEVAQSDAPFEQAEIRWPDFASFGDEVWKQDFITTRKNHIERTIFDLYRASESHMMQANRFSVQRTYPAYLLFTLASIVSFAFILCLLALYFRLLKDVR